MADVLGVVLAGGAARRMGGRDKALVTLAGRPLLAHVVERFAPQVEILVISANGDPARFGEWGLPVIADPFEENVGPLAGIAAAGLWARAHRPSVRRIASVSVDTPLLPLDLVDRLAAALDARPSAGMAAASSQGGVHPTAALHSVDRLDALLDGLRAGSVRRLMGWLDVCGAVTVDFSAPDVDPFANLNTEADVAAAEAHLA